MKNFNDLFLLIEKLEIEIEKCSPWCWLRYITNKEKFICPNCLLMIKQVKTLRRQVRRMYLEMNND